MVRTSMRRYSYRFDLSVRLSRPKAVSPAGPAISAGWRALPRMHRLSIYQQQEFCPLPPRYLWRVGGVQL
jgi:hypothetical protein